MSKIDKVDADLTAPKSTLRDIEKTLTASDIDSVLSADIPLESKKSQLLGLIALLDGKNRDGLLEKTEHALSEIEAQIEDTPAPKIAF